MAAPSVEPGTDTLHNQLLKVHVEAHQGGVLVRVVGEVDLTTALLLRGHLEQAQVQLTPPAPLVLDMTGVDFLASVGLSELITLSDRCHDRGSRLVVVAPQRAVLRSMHVTGLTETITVVPSVDDALNTTA